MTSALFVGLAPRVLRFVVRTRDGVVRTVERDHDDMHVDWDHAPQTGTLYRAGIVLVRDIVACTYDREEVTP